MAPPFEIVSMHIKTLASATNFGRTFEINIFETETKESSRYILYFPPYVKYIF